MRTEEAIEIVEAYQLWRRDKNVPSKYKQPDPTELGKAIDKLIDVAKDSENPMPTCIQCKSNKHMILEGWHYACEMCQLEYSGD